MMEEINRLLSRIVDCFRQPLGKKVSGIYLHGSLAMGCFHHKKSDIDLLVLVSEKLTLEDKYAVIHNVLRLEGQLPLKGLEFSVVHESVLNPFLYPTPYELHYSIAHHKKYTEDSGYLCTDGVDEDLAAHLTITYERGVCLYGRPLKELIPPIDRQFFVQSILSDLKFVKQEISGNPVYYVLNLLRALYFLQEGILSSKQEAGEWALNTLPLIREFEMLVAQCLQDYRGELVDAKQYAETRLIRFADLILAWMNQISE
ncbi:aminoglycoside adenylyltransferase domain-containing protein [Brevibacillus ginsengisoli]|uniref:aminoglycoside adenylyltransferase domain-containing protein n=1 Tax=Brevibacillus ginsengisoli TaxID=363854 RepID=UPI003CF608E6